MELNDDGSVTGGLYIESGAYGGYWCWEPMHYSDEEIWDFEFILEHNLGYDFCYLETDTSAYYYADYTPWLSNNRLDDFTAP